MTREQILALSGRELDHAVAEHVFKWQRWDHFEDQAETRPITEFIRPGRRYPVRASAYSTSYDAMGVLIERMTAQGWNMYIEGGYENEFQCGFSRVPDGEINDEDIVWFYAKGCTAAQAVSEIPEAVARAALLAVGEEMHRDLQAPL